MNINIGKEYSDSDFSLDTKKAIEPLLLRPKLTLLTLKPIIFLIFLIYLFNLLSKFHMYNLLLLWLKAIT